jgi:hypothetical protein
LRSAPASHVTSTTAHNGGYAVVPGTTSAMFFWPSTPFVNVQMEARKPRQADLLKPLFRTLGGPRPQSRRRRRPSPAQRERPISPACSSSAKERSWKALPRRPDVLLVNATGRDHPRRAGLALHLGAILGLPTVGVTHRTLLASGDWPDDERGAMAPLMLAGDLVGYWLRTKRGCRPLAVHAAWRTDPQTGVELALASGKPRGRPSRCAAA